MKYENLNLVAAGTRPDGRPFYTRNRVPGISDMILLTNTDEGDAWSIAFKVERPFRNRFFANVSYLYGRSRSILDGTVVAGGVELGQRLRPGRPEQPAADAIELRSGSPHHRLGQLRHPDAGAGFTATASVFYSGQSGRPWSANYAFDYNGDVRGTNDLLYIPTSARRRSPTRNGTYEDLMTFVNAEECLADFIGKIHERNACRVARGSTPSICSSTSACRSGAPRRSSRGTCSTCSTCSTPTAACVEYANFNDLLVVRPRHHDGRQINYNLQNLFVNGVRQTPQEQFTRNDLLSRWQMQFGGRIRF